MQHWLYNTVMQLGIDELQDKIEHIIQDRSIGEQMADNSALCVTSIRSTTDKTVSLLCELVPHFIKDVVEEPLSDMPKKNCSIKPKVIFFQGLNPRRFTAGRR